MTSNFEQGFSNGVVIRGVSLTTTNPGKVFWVNNSTALAVRGVGGSDGNKGDYIHPFATVDFAVSQCTANRGDIVFIMPAHNEGGTVPSLFDIDVAGVAVVGLGYKGNRATFDYDDTDVDIVISAANCTLANVNLRASIGDVVRGIHVTANNARIYGCEFLEEAGGDNFIDFILTSTTDNAADGLAVIENKVVSADTGNNSFVELSAVHTGLDLIGNHIHLGTSTESIVGVPTSTDTVLGLYLADNDIFHLIGDSSSVPLMFQGANNSCTGLIVRNMIGHADVAGELMMLAGSDIRCCENFGAGVDDKSGRAVPIVIASTSDMRLKTNIVRIGQLLGFNIYQWDWNDLALSMGINDPTTGVMAQEVQHTGCVIERDGWLRVNYQRLFGIN